ncbi:helix-turn-helix transcriptional regulator [Streptomyces hyaluromycini]|uniref:helix-turn-helix transcriptional regulator n=1 Tax=Streptomyces hyaluromycini TaxID=1377993 RepID=UPI000B5CAAF9|nr:AraC family transcriptional regulator [Streptomyces hyaluromycini]
MYSWSEALTLTSASAWDELFTGLHGASRISVPDREAPWRARLEWQQSTAYGVALCAGGREVVQRETRHIRSDPRGTYELLVPLAGTAWVEQGPSATEIRAGSMVLCDIDRPMKFAHDADFLSIAFIMSGENISARSRIAAGEPQLLGAERGLGRIVRQLTTTLHEERAELSERTFDLACDRLLDLVCLAAEGGTDTAPAGQRATVEAAVRRYVRQHACERDLDVVAVARALGWSVRYVQQVLQDAGTTARDLIRRERLNAARERLAGPGWASYSIAQIAHSCGFGSHASFATAFRAEFGTTPSEARRRRAS